MKNIMLAALFILVSQAMQAQKITCTDCRLTTTIGEMSGFEFVLPKSDATDVAKSLEKWLKKQDGKVTNKKGEVAATNVMFKDIYSEPVTVYATVLPAGADVNLKVSVSSDKGLTDEQIQKFKDEFRTFAVVEAKKAAEARLADGQKELTVLNNEILALKKANEKLQKDIDDCNTAIIKNKETIQANDLSQDKKTPGVNTQAQKVKDMEAELKGIY